MLSGCGLIRRVAPRTAPRLMIATTPTLWNPQRAHLSASWLPPSRSPSPSPLSQLTTMCRKEAPLRPGPSHGAATESPIPGIFFVNVADDLGYHSYRPDADSPASPQKVDTAALKTVSADTPGPHTAYEKRFTPKVGDSASHFQVSPVYESGGVLWQWRTVTVAATAKTATPSARQQRKHHVQRADEPRDSAYVWLPFILHPNGPGIGWSTSGGIVLSQPAHTHAISAAGLTADAHAASAPPRVTVPSACGDLLATVAPSVPSSMPSSSSSPCKADLVEWSCAYIDLLQRLAMFSKGLHASPPSSSSSSSVARVVLTSPYEYICRARNTASWVMEENQEEEDAMFRTPGLIGGGAHDVDDGDAADGGDDEEELEAVVVVEPCHRPAPFDETARAPPSALRSSRTPRPPSHTDAWIPESHQNVLVGGLAALVLAIDSYAALVARKELTVAAACWAVLCDTPHRATLPALRTHALETEREVLAAVAAHEALSALALEKQRTLVGKCESVPRTALPH